MDYNQRSRGQKVRGRSSCPCARRSVSSRMGLEKRGAPAQQPPRGNAPRPNQQRGPNQPPRSGQPPRQNRPGQNQSNNGRRPRPQQQINPQKKRLHARLAPPPAPRDPSGDFTPHAPPPLSGDAGRAGRAGHRRVRVGQPVVQGGHLPGRELRPQHPPPTPAFIPRMRSSRR